MLCPPGFLPTPPPGADELLGCTPDPADCGSDPFGGVPEGVGTVFVAANGKPNGTGSRADPFATIGEGVAALPAGGTVAVAEGTYAENVVINQKIALLGRCAAKVKLTASQGPPVLIATNGADGARISGVTFAKSTAGLRVQAAADVAASKLWCQDNLTRGVAVVQGGRLQLFNSYVENTGKASPTPLLSIGITASGAGTQLALDHVRISGCAAPAVQGEGPVKIAARDVLADRGNPQHVFGGNGRAFNVFDGAGLELQGVRLYRMEDTAISLNSSLCSLVAKRLRIEKTLFSATSNAGGYAVNIGKGASGQVLGARITDSGDTALAAVGVGAKLSIASAWIAGTARRNPDDSGYGGITAATSGAISVQDSVLAAHGFWGALADTDGEIAMQRVLIAGSGWPAKVAGTGGGARAQMGGALTMQGVRATGCKGSAFEIASEGALTAKDLVADNGLPTDYGDGPAIAADTGATVRVQGCRLSQSHMVAVLAYEPTTTVSLSNCLIDGTLAAPNNGLGMGLVAQGGPKIALAGVRLTGNIGGGAVIADAGGQLRAHGIVVDATQVRTTDGSGGHGIYGAKGADVELTGVLVTGNRSTGVAQEHGKLTADRLVVRATQFAPLVGSDLKAGQQLADGVLASQADGVQLARSAFFGNARAAVLADASKAGALAACYVRGGLYGVVAQSGSVIATSGSAIFGASQQNQSGDAGLAVPPPPLLVGN